MKIGTYYYPEQWPRAQWERDFDTMARMGLQIVHMGEFAWFEMEPTPGDIRLDWLEKCVSMAQKRGLEVILCTPTAAPPIWLAQIPGVLPVKADGTTMRFGHRRHYTPTSVALREAAERIVTALALRFGDHPAVIGWQIDNEYNDATGSFDQSEETHRLFRVWLRQKYGTLERLHQAWGCQFWNTYYTDFDQILMPATRQPTIINPHTQLDASRFWSCAYAQFNKLQVDILRQHVGDRFITTNFMLFVPDVNPSDMAPDFDLMTWDSYPVGGFDKDLSTQNFRIGDPGSITFMHGYMASFHRRWAVMELQPGQINWGAAPVIPMPGAVRLWLWTAFAYGADFVTTYRLRQVLFGCEMFHAGLITPDGVTPSSGGEEFIQTIEEMRRLDLAAVPPLSQDDLRPGETVGLVFDWEQYWWYTSQPLGKRWNYGRWLCAWQAAIARLGLKVRVLSPGTSWPADLPLIIAPGLQMTDASVIRQMTEYVEGGGHLVLTCRSGVMDRDGHLYETPIAESLRPLIKARIRAFDGLPEGLDGKIEMDGEQHPWGAWGDLVDPDPGTEVLATYADQFYAGTAAITEAKHGAGVVTYLGVCAEPVMLDALMRRLMPGREALPERVQVLRRGPYRVLLNYRDHSIDAPAPAGTKFLVGEASVPAAGVAVWEE